MIPLTETRACVYSGRRERSPIMNDVTRIENLVLGGGEAGKYVAWELAGQGRPVVVIERALIGGSCPNVACLPSKNVIRSAKVADLVRNATSYGVHTASVMAQMEGVRQRKRTMVEGLIATHQKKFSAPNIEFVLADGRLVGPRTVEAKLANSDRRRFVAERLFLNMGTHAAEGLNVLLADVDRSYH
jgi:pyruvate/2-oxoglutarate dehydrogenase complex dihydrolipoamide dehydrogenase (E3) component